MGSRLIWLAITSGCGIPPVDHDPVTVPAPTSPTSEPSEPALDCPSTPEAAEVVLGVRCAACHGPGSPAFGGFGDALDADALAAGGWVVARDPDASRILDTVRAGVMPPVSGGGALSDRERSVLERWIACGAESWGTVASTRGFLSPAMVFEAALADVRALPAEDRGGARYLSLVPLYDAGVPADTLRGHAAALGKLTFGLTVEDRVPPLVPVALDGVPLPDGTVVRVADDLGASLLFRVDLEALGWDDPVVDRWEELAKAWPFGVRYDRELDAAGDLVALTRSRLPIVAGDWFVAEASIQPLYGEILGLPHTLPEFLLQFGGIADADRLFADGNVDCAGIDGATSQVSDSNRAICRYDAVHGYCWQTFDFRSSAGDGNLFANPAGFRATSGGSEVLCSLPSGQQVYGVFDAAGTRLDDAPTDLVWDPDPAARGVVTTARGCIRCHTTGVLPVVDQVRDVVTGDPSSYEPEVVELVLQWYPVTDTLAALQNGDAAEFLVSLAQIPGVGGPEPVSALSASYEAPVAAVRVAADLGLVEADLLARLDTNEDLRVQYGGLYGAAATVEREVFEFVARDTICGLGVGDTCDEAAFCGVSSVPCPAGTPCDALGRCVSAAR